MVRAWALVGIVAISFSSILVKAADVSPGTSAFFRAALAVPLLVVVWLTVRREDHRPASARALAAFAGVLFALDLNAWHRSIDLIGAGLATVLGNTQVLFVGVIAWLTLREPPRRVALLAVPVALLGIVLVAGVGPGNAYGSDPALGTLLGVTTGAFYAGFLILLRQSNASLSHPAGPLLDATAGASVGTLAVSVLDPAFTLTPGWPALGWLVLLAWGAHVGGWLLISRALPRLPALDTSVLLLLQPVLASVWGYLLFAERPSLLQWVGVALVLGGIALHETWPRRVDAPAGDAAEAPVQ